MSKLRIIVWISVIFVFVNILVYYATQVNAEQRIRIALEDNLNDLQTHIEILLYNQKSTADAIFMLTVRTAGVVDILTRVQTASSDEKAQLRAQLYTLLKPKYEILKHKGVLQYQFVLLNNHSFLRMHKPNKFGDDLSDVREDFKYTNETKKRIRGFTQGKTTHGFRNIYPILDKVGNHIASMEVSFSSDSFQEYLTNISKIHTHFILDKHIFEAKTWKRDDLVLKYLQSSENKDFMLTMNSVHTQKKCIIENNLKLQQVRQEINKKMRIGRKFALYVKYNNHIEVVSFFPIKNLQHTKTLAWFVSYEKNAFIQTTLNTNIVVRVLSFLSFFIFGYFVYLHMMIQQRVKEEHRLLGDVLNSTDDMMFVTDFKTVSFSNRTFKDFFNVQNEKEFNKRMAGNFLNIFMQEEGYLHQGLLTMHDTFSSLLLKTKQEERVVSLISPSLEQKLFHITLSKTSYGNTKEYLVTLRDITKQKEKEAQIQKKAYIDSLTGVYNRNKFDEEIGHELQREARHKRSLSVAIVDIDHFKVFNDTYGHLVGDEVLIMLAQQLNKDIRTTDIFARWGGEEFVLLLPETTKEDALIVCNKLRIGVETLNHPLAGGITVSFGLTQYQEGDSKESLFKRCDDALYDAKESGRNKVRVK